MGVFSKSGDGSDREIETVIGPSVKVEGNFVGSGNVVIEGAFSGSLKTSHDLRVGSEARVKADVEAANAYVAGEIRGNLKVAGRTELTASAKVHGNIETKVLSVEAGAFFNGKSVMAVAETPAVSGLRPPASNAKPASKTNS